MLNAHGVLRSKIGGKPAGLLLNIHNGRETYGQETKSNFPNKNHYLFLVSRHEPFFLDLEFIH